MLLVDSLPSSSKTSDAKKAELTQQLWDLVKGSASKLIFAHDMSRVIQCLLVYGNSEIRDGLFEELKPELIRVGMYSIRFLNVISDVKVTVCEILRCEDVKTWVVSCVQ